MRRLMRRPIRFVLATLGVLLLWTALVGIGLLEGWWRSPLAPRGDTEAFMNALVREVETTRVGNVGLSLIEDGSVHAEHMSSVGEPVDRDTVFQVASLSKWVTAWGVMALVEQGRVDAHALPALHVGSWSGRWSLPGEAAARASSHDALNPSGLRTRPGITVPSGRRCIPPGFVAPGYVNSFGRQRCTSVPRGDTLRSRH